MDIAARAINDWHESFELLKKSQNKECYSPNLELPSKATVNRVTKWIVAAYQIAPELPAPDVTPDGEGELHIEWETEDKFITIYIRKSEPRFDRIYFRQGREFENFPLNKTNLTKVLHAL